MTGVGDTDPADIADGVTDLADSLEAESGSFREGNGSNGRDGV